jgi:hypothetical protein
LTSQISPGPPPALTSDTYEDSFNEIKSIGIQNGTTATPDQKQVGLFWNGAIQNYWNEIAQTLSIDHDLTTAQNARLFALLDLSLADTVIAFYDAKYAFNFWRPVALHARYIPTEAARPHSAAQMESSSGGRVREDIVIAHSESAWALMGPSLDLAPRCFPFLRVGSSGSGRRLPAAIELIQPGN